MVGVQTQLDGIDKVLHMNKFAFGDDKTGAAAPASRLMRSRLGRSRTADEELARILGGIGTLPDFLPHAERAEALSRAAILEWQP